MESLVYVLKMTFGWEALALVKHLQMSHYVSKIGLKSWTSNVGDLCQVFVRDFNFKHNCIKLQKKKSWSQCTVRGIPLSTSSICSSQPSTKNNKWSFPFSKISSAKGLNVCFVLLPSVVNRWFKFLHRKSLGSDAFSFGTFGCSIWYHLYSLPCTKLSFHRSTAELHLILRPYIFFFFWFHESLLIPYKGCPVENDGRMEELGRPSILTRDMFSELITCAFCWCFLWFGCNKFDVRR